MQRRHNSIEDQRTPFQKDRDRILYTYAFRRLAGVTQVVSPVEGHIFHNRLTHTIEVSQIARRLAESLLKNHHDIAQAHGGLDADVAESAALAHDLGHPPFGHVAEKELDRVVVGAGVPEGYEGNAQSFRIVAKLAVRGEGTAQAPGLDLTRATLNACLKYPWFRQTHGKHSRKWGYYHSEQDDFDFARASFGGAAQQPCLEAQVMTWADDIGYSVHDTEDFFRARLLLLDRIASFSNPWTASEGAMSARKRSPSEIRRILVIDAETKEPPVGVRRPPRAAGRETRHSRGDSSTVQAFRRRDHDYPEKTTILDRDAVDASRGGTSAATSEQSQQIFLTQSGKKLATDDPTVFLLLGRVHHAPNKGE